MKPIRNLFTAVAVLLLAALGVAEYLNFTNYCYAQRRYLPDDELIEIAGDYNIKFSNKAPDAIQYSDTRDLLKKNIGCCAVRTTDWGPFEELAPDRWLRIFGFQTIVVEIWYRLKMLPPRNYSDSFVAMDACGKVSERHGIYENFPRRTTDSGRVL